LDTRAVDDRGRDDQSHSLERHGLDLAIVGNGRTAALVDPQARIVWWCYPRYDGDPVFCRLLAGKEEKGFADVVLDDIVDYQCEYLRNSAIVSTTLTDRRRPACHHSGAAYA